MKLFVIKDQNSLKPADERSDDYLKKIKQGQWFSIDIRKPRNLQHHRKFWALMNLISENLDNVTPEILCDVIKIRTGHAKIVKTKKGEIAVPLSLNFSKMDQIAFDDFYDKAVKIIVEDILENIKAEEIKDEVLKMLN